MTRTDEEFERLNIANTKLMKAIMKALSRNFDYEIDGEAKCEELYACVIGLEKSEFATDFVSMINELPQDCDIKAQCSQNRAIKEAQDQLDILLNLATKDFISAGEYNDEGEPLKNALVKL